MAFSRNLLDEALNPKLGFVLVEDFVETSGAFVLHQLLKNSLLKSEEDIGFFFAFAQGFVHYDRVLRKLGCNLSIQRDKKKLFFFELLDRQFPGDAGCRDLYAELHKIVIRTHSSDQGHQPAITIFIDDISLLEASTGGSVDHVLDFLHYCTSLGCSVIALTHADVYENSAGPTLLSHLEYLADTIIKAESLRSGWSPNVHGQLTVMGETVNRGKAKTFLFRVKENAVDYFYPGMLT